jgi:NAD(P)-dependent dehydrogenase (short-subunit alcohol dehydrogenase family)
MKNVFILGGSSPIGQDCINIFLQNKFKVTYFGRKKINIKNNNLIFKKVDLEKKNNIGLLFSKFIKKSNFSHLCFLQRSRAKEKLLANEIKVSVEPTIQIIDEFIKYNKYKKNNIKKSILIFSSPASRKIALEQPLSYHFGKAMIDQMIRFYSIKVGSINCNINGISPAFVLKKRAEKFYNKNKKLTHLINNIVPQNKMIKSNELAKIAFSLMQDNLHYLNGQIIDVDGGLNVHENASLSRLTMKVLSDF